MVGTYPDSQVPRARSARQQFWLDHLRAWQAQGTSLRAYAAAKGLSSSSLYRARRRLERRGLLSGSEEATAAFVPVRVTAPAPACRVLLPNGVVVPRAHRARDVRDRARMREPAAMIRPPTTASRSGCASSRWTFARITGLATLVQDQLSMDPFSAQLFGSPTGAGTKQHSTYQSRSEVVEYPWHPLYRSLTFYRQVENRGGWRSSRQDPIRLLMRVAAMDVRPRCRAMDRVHHKCPSLHSKNVLTLLSSQRAHYRMTIAGTETQMSRHRKRTMGQLALSLDWPQSHRVPPQIQQEVRPSEAPVDRPCHGRCPIDRWRGTRPWIDDDVSRFARSVGILR